MILSLVDLKHTTLKEIEAHMGSGKCISHPRIKLLRINFDLTTCEDFAMALDLVEIYHIVGSFKFDELVKNALGRFLF